MQWHKLLHSHADEHVLFTSHWKLGMREDGDLSEPQFFRVVTLFQQILQQNKGHMSSPASSSAWFLTAYVSPNIWVTRIPDDWNF